MVDKIKTKKRKPDPPAVVEARKRNREREARENQMMFQGYIDSRRENLDG
jgi:hypothetical protein